MTDPTRPRPPRSELDEIFHVALQEGRLIYQRSAHNAWLPPRSEDPVTLSDEWEWTEANGRARLISWVIYHVAYHPYFANRIPYQVAIVELEEGPRMIAPLDTAREPPHIDQDLQIDIRKEDGDWLPVFVPVQAFRYAAE